MEKKGHLSMYDRGIIRQICGRIHVGTSDLDVLRTVVKSINGGNRTLREHTTRAFRRAFYGYAIRCHRANQDCYAKVMSGRL